MVVREGSNVTLKCAATGSPSPSIVWRREGGEKIMLFSGNDGKMKPVLGYVVKFFLRSRIIRFRK